MVKMLSHNFLIFVLALLWGCEPNLVDVVVGDVNDSDSDTGSDRDTNSESSDPPEDGVLASVIVPPDFAATPLRIDAIFFKPEDNPPMQPAGWGSSFEIPSINANSNPDNPYLMYSKQAGLKGKYAVHIVLYVEGGALELNSGWSPRPKPGVDWTGNCERIVELGPGTGVQDCGFAPLVNRE